MSSDEENNLKCILTKSKSLKDIVFNFDAQDTQILVSSQTKGQKTTF